MVNGSSRATVVVLAGARTPLGNFGGALKDVTATELAAVAARGAIARSGIDPTWIDDVVLGNVVQSSADAVYLARHAALRAGIGVAAPALTLNRLCGSGLQAVLTAAQSLILGQTTFALAGGTESMSQAPHVIRGARSGFSLGQGSLQDTLWEALTDAYAGTPMAITAENLAERYGVSREACDEFALRSQARALDAAQRGYFAQEIVPVEVPGPKGSTIIVDRDEGPRAGLTREKLAKLPARFKTGGVVTPANASGITDGAAAMVLTTKATAQARGVSWIAELAGSGVIGVPPEIMGIGPAYAIPKALNAADLAMSDLATVEINEAFAPQVLACLRELGVNGDLRLNPNGGAISLGHPLGASGARIALTAIHDVRERGGGYGLASACIGGGQGIAAVFKVA